MNQSMNIEDVYDLYDDYFWWGCPRCSSEEIGEITIDEVLDGVSYGFRTVWLCGGCGCEFDEPDAYGPGTTTA